MRFLIIILFALFLFSCAAPARSPRKSAAPDPAKIEKNKETALLNEVGEVVRSIQSLEKLGRNMDAYRQAPDAESRRTCQQLMEDRKREISELEIRIKNLPNNFSAHLTPPLADLNQCVSCLKQANENCVKARAAINKAIKEIFP